MGVFPPNNHRQKTLQILEGIENLGGKLEGKNEVDLELFFGSELISKAHTLVGNYFNTRLKINLTDARS